MNWIPHASALADQIVPATSRWWSVVASVPRHEFVPRWWVRTADSFDGSRWRLEDGAANEKTWAEITYADRPLVTQVGRLHADRALRGDHPVGVALSCSSRPRHLIRMFQHAYLSDDADVLHIGTGSGYGCALLATLLGDCHVTSVDIDEHLTSAASERLTAINLHPRLLTLDATRPLPGTFDRIIATVAVQPIPVTWLDALRPGGRLVTAIAGTALILTADKTPEGGAVGRIEWDPATFMTARTGSDLPGRLTSAYDRLRNDGGEQITKGRYPVIDLMRTTGLRSMLGVTAPGIEHHYQAHDDGRDAAWMFHPDGSWARAVGSHSRPADVYQGGPRRLWDILDDLRSTWLRDGSLPVYGAKATISPHGVIHLQHGHWQTTIH